MPLDWAPFVNLVHSHQRFLLTTHVRPDGDGLGSMLALADVLQDRGKSVQMVVASTLISMGMMVLPPFLISLPFKILLFVLVDGWHLVIGSLVQSFYG